MKSPLNILIQQMLTLNFSYIFEFCGVPCGLAGLSCDFRVVTTLTVFNGLCEHAGIAFFFASTTSQALARLCPAENEHFAIKK